MPPAAPHRVIGAEAGWAREAAASSPEPSGFLQPLQRSRIHSFNPASADPMREITRNSRIKSVDSCALLELEALGH